MGRPTFYRQRILSQASSLEAKGFFNYLVSEIKARREVSLEEAVLIARDVEDYLQKNHLVRQPGQILFPAIAGRTNYQKRARRHQEEQEITLSVIDEEDIENMAEFGITGLRKGRIARIIEEAYAQDAILDGYRLLFFILETHLGIRNLLRHFWQQGVILPVAGMRVKNRQLMQTHRSVLALKRYLEGEDLDRIRNDLAISTSRWQRLWAEFKAYTQTGSSGQLPEVEAGWQKLWQQHRDHLGQRLPAEEPGTSSTFSQLLQTRHGYSPAAAEQFIDDLHDLAARLNRQDQQPNQIIYSAVCDQEPAGKKLTECQLRAVVIDYIADEDFEQVDRESTRKLKWARLVRYATQARSQGAVLSQPDLALLLGVSTDTLQRMLKQHPEVAVPTRGLVADMGPALSHAEKVIDLFMNGYTETEIVRRTHHSYDAIETYILDYARVAYLLEKGMPAPAIRKALGFSRKRVDKYIHLYRAYSGPDYAFMTGKLRRLVEAHPVKKN